jgi:hypothetical protein
MRLSLGGTMSGIDITSIASWLQFAAWTIVIIVGGNILRTKVKKSGGLKNMSLSHKGIHLALAVGLLLSATSLYFNFRPRTVEKVITNIEPYKFKWTGNSATPKYRVVGKTFRDEIVPLDDTEYTDCKFFNVQFLYNGTAPSRLLYNDIEGFEVISNNPSISGTLELAYALNTVSAPLLASRTGKPQMHANKILQTAAPQTPEPRP